MGNILKMSFILFAVAAFAAGLLAYYNGFTTPHIEKLKAENEKQARLYVIPDAKEFEEVAIKGIAGENFYKALDANKSVIGYVFVAKGAGYSGSVETMVGMDTGFKIINIKVIKQTETPGLGAECQTIKFGSNHPYFEDWFKGKTAMNVVVVKDDQNSADKIQSLTGSTITTRAVCKSIAYYAKAVQSSAGDSTMTTAMSCSSDSTNCPAAKSVEAVTCSSQTAGGK